MTNTPTESKEAQRKQIDWVSLIIPTVFALLFQFGMGLFYFGGVTSRLAAVEEKQKNYEVDRVTRHDLEERDTAGETYRQELNLRLNRMDDKLDQILVNQSGMGNGKRN